MRKVVPLVPSATEAALHEEESLAAPESPGPITTESNTTVVDSMGCAVVQAVTNVVGAVVKSHGKKCGPRDHQGTV